MFRVALLGNPNSGKSSLFNALTGQNQKVGNWPGVTVEKKEGFFTFKERKFQVVDLPGTYSLSPYSIDERIARDYIVKDKPDVVVVIADSTNLERNLYLLTEIMEIHDRVILVLNMSDMAEKYGIKVREHELSVILGIPVVKTVANKGIGVEDLKSKLVDTLEKDVVFDREKFMRSMFGDRIFEKLKKIVALLKRTELSYPEYYVATKLLEKDEEIRSTTASLENVSNIREILEEVDRIIREIEAEFNDDSISVLAARRYAFIHGVYKEVVEKESSISQRIDITERIDQVMTNRYLGIPIFLVLMYFVFFLVFKLGTPLSDWIDRLMGKFAGFIGNGLYHLGMSKYIVSFITDGVIGGAGSVLVFLPNIMILYFLLALLEDSGYMARAAFVVDKIMHKFGLHGKSAIPMVISFGCNIPGILATRTLKSEKDRLLTILVIPMIPCSARLPIFVLFGSVFFPKYKAFFVFSMYVIGLLVAFASAILLNKLFFNEKGAPLVMELPPYRIPDMKVVFRVVKDRTWMFLKKAGTFIMLTVALVWLLASLPQGVSYASSESLIGRIGSILAPLFRPPGFGFWQATVSLISGFLAKEVVVGTLGTVLGAGENSLAAILPHYFTINSALSFSIFSLLYVPCVAAVAAIWKETNLKWALFSVFYSMTVAYVVSLVVYVLSRFIF